MWGSRVLLPSGMASLGSTSSRSQAGSRRCNSASAAAKAARSTSVGARKPRPLAVRIATAYSTSPIRPACASALMYAESMVRSSHGEVPLPRFQVADFFGSKSMPAPSTISNSGVSNSPLPRCVTSRTATGLSPRRNDQSPTSGTNFPVRGHATVRAKMNVAAFSPLSEGKNLSRRALRRSANSPPQCFRSPSSSAPKRLGSSTPALSTPAAIGFRSLASAGRRSRVAANGIEPPPAVGSNTLGTQPQVASRTLCSRATCLSPGLFL